MDTIEDAIEAKEELIDNYEVKYVKEDTLQIRMSNLFGKLSRTFGWGPSPTKVIHINWHEYTSKSFIFEDGMFAISPLSETTTEGEINISYEIIIQAEINNTKYAYSLLRTSTEEEAINIMNEYRLILPCLVDCLGREFLNQSTLQKVLDVLRENSSFNSAHIVSYFGFIDALKNEFVISVLNEPENEKHKYPIHVAVENESEKVISHLLSSGASIEVFDKHGNSPLHMAASISVSIIQSLKPRQHKCLNTTNAKGETPLLIAAKSSKLDNVKCLIHMGANLNHDEDIQPNFETQSYNDKLKFLENTRDISHKDLHSGGSLLHWGKTREMTNLALDMGCFPDLLNDCTQTPLHIMVLRGRLQCLMALLSRGANSHIANNEGNTPLHLASSLCSIPMVQALICFGADINATNLSGETPRHLAATVKTEDRNKQGDKDKVIYLLHAVGAKRCRIKLASCSEGCYVDGSFNGVPLYEKPSLRARWVFDEHLAKTQIIEALKYQTLFRSGLRGRGRVLCLDGGGIKGLVLCQMLDVISNLIGQPISDSFDWIAGTSTGGFLALDLASGKSIQHAQSLYYSLKDKVFVGTRPYDSDDLETILKEEFGEDTTMNTLTRAKVCITTTLADRLPADLHLFRNYEAPIDVLGIGESSDFVKPPPPHTQKIWQAARSSGAAPTYFKSTDKYLDGGLVANNPVLDTLAEIEEWNMAVRAAGRDNEVFTPTVVVSLGCGKCPVVKVDNVDVTLPSILEMRKSFQALYNMFNLLVEQTCAADGQVMDRARAWCSSLHVPLFRFNPVLSEDCALDEHDDLKLTKVMWEARSYMESQSIHLAHLKNLLISSETIPDPLTINRESTSQLGWTLPKEPKKLAPTVPPRVRKSSTSSLIDLNKDLVEDNVLIKGSQSVCHLPNARSHFVGQNDLAQQFFGAESEFGNEKEIHNSTNHYYPRVLLKDEDVPSVHDSFPSC